MQASVRLARCAWLNPIVNATRFDVLQLGPFPPPHGGVQTNLVAIRDYLRSHGIECRVINLTRFRQPDHDNVFYPRSALELLVLLLRLPRDVIHLHIGGDLTTRLLLVGLLCCMLPGSRTVLTFHSGGYPTSPAGLKARPTTFAGFVLRRFDALIAVNQQLADLFVKGFGVPPDRVRNILPHALPDRIPDGKLPQPIEDFFATHGPVMLSMGWLEPEYDFPLQIRALGLVRVNWPQAGLIILGEGRLQPELSAEIAATSYPSHVLMPGDIPHDLSLMAIGRSDIFLRTTLYDGDSISVREALHFGTPVIASDNGMRPAGVRLIPKQNLAALVEAIGQQIRRGRLASQAGESDQGNIEAVYRLYSEITGPEPNLSGR